MTDNDIVRALECCKDPMASCDECFLVNADRSCERTLMGYALNLINRLQAKNEALRMDNAQLHSDIINANMNLEHMTAEIERLKFNLKAVLDERADHTEAIKEFAERLRTQSVDAMGFVIPEDVVCVDDIDNLVKEMVGDTE